jgi:AcrR family transcriptional regulator
VRTQQARREATRAALLGATVGCLVDHGYAGTTTQRVQDRAGVSRGALLHHFASKEQLLVAAVHHVAQAQVDRLRAGAASGGEAGLDLLRDVMSGPLFLAGLELWLAARTEPALHAALLPAERQVGAALGELADRLFDGPGRAGLHGLLALLRGLAVTSVLREDRALDREVVQLWVERALAG